MFEKNMTIGYLLDFYGELLGERRRELLALYYPEDYSLAEIAAEVGISRQGVRENIKRGEEELHFFEEKLGMAARFAEMRRLTAGIDGMIEASTPDQLSPDLRDTLRRALRELRERIN